MGPVAIVQTGTANLASVVAAVERSGTPWSIIDDPRAVVTADRLILPGVGAFGAAMRRLDERALTGPLRDRVLAGRPTLAICLGMQMLFAGSAESPGVAGIGALPGEASRFDGGGRVPQLGWNRIVPDPACRIIEPGSAYFANSYRVTTCPSGWGAAWSDHGGPFIGAIERGVVLACQFHPELSGAWGQRLLRRWLQTAGVPAQEVGAC